MSDMLNTKWQRDGNLLYSLLNGVNYNEIRITRANGNTNDKDCAEAAEKLHAMMQVTKGMVSLLESVVKFDSDIGAEWIEDANTVLNHYVELVK